MKKINSLDNITLMSSNSLDNITLDSDELRSIERFENNYYNYKNNIVQNGSSNNYKLEKNIKRLHNCYVLSLNQNGGKNNELSLIIKKKLDKKYIELILYKNLEGGLEPITTTIILSVITKEIYDAIMENKNKINENYIQNIIKQILTKYLKDIPKELFKIPSNIMKELSIKPYIQPEYGYSHGKQPIDMSLFKGIDKFFNISQVKK